ncbi:adenylosuccinate synthetase protein [Rutstroemia sp. NJR-2017a BBW]|nr:adenylosuccinate synthetase protein [Rutstroemia sp. NJR-2017a BBW]
MATVVLGAQWGDEGKGKLVDILCREDLRLCCRAQGGNNAGDFHILPSGLLNPACTNLVGSGCVVHIPGLLKELEALEEKLPGARERLLISDRCHVVLDLHQKLDGLEEAELGGGKIGTTGKGIGPCYSTKMARSGVRIADIFREDFFEEKVRAMASGAKKRFGDLLQYDVEEELVRFKKYRAELASLVVDQLPLLVDAQKADAPMLIEGANAIMLDIDAGTYPGLNPRKVKNIYGVVKAYTTRVGGGPFPTEDLGKVGETLQEVGREFGVTTGRRRRCGWLDLVVVKYSTNINSYTAINLTKLDILDSFEEIKIAVAYRNPATGERLESFPADLNLLEKLEPEYVTMKGWNEPITGARSYYELPLACRQYCEFIEKEVGVKIKFIGVGKLLPVSRTKISSLTMRIIGPSREDMISK